MLTYYDDVADEQVDKNECEPDDLGLLRQKIKEAGLLIVSFVVNEREHDSVGSEHTMLTHLKSALAQQECQRGAYGSDGTDQENGSDNKGRPPQRPNECRHLFPAT